MIIRPVHQQRFERPILQSTEQMHRYSFDCELMLLIERKRCSGVIVSFSSIMSIMRFCLADNIIIFIRAT